MSSSCEAAANGLAASSPREGSLSAWPAAAARAPEALMPAPSAPRPCAAACSAAALLARNAGSPELGIEKGAEEAAAPAPAPADGVPGTSRLGLPLDRPRCSCCWRLSSAASRVLQPGTQGKAWCARGLEGCRGRGSTGLLGRLGGACWRWGGRGCRGWGMQSHHNLLQASSHMHTLLSRRKGHGLLLLALGAWPKMCCLASSSAPPPSAAAPPAARTSAPPLMPQTWAALQGCAASRYA